MMLSHPLSRKFGRELFVPPPPLVVIVPLAVSWFKVSCKGVRPSWAGSCPPLVAPLFLFFFTSLLFFFFWWRQSFRFSGVLFFRCYAGAEHLFPRYTRFFRSMFSDALFDVSPPLADLALICFTLPCTRRAASRSSCFFAVGTTFFFWETLLFSNRLFNQLSFPRSTYPSFSLAQTRLSATRNAFLFFFPPHPPHPPPPPPHRALHFAPVWDASPFALTS